MKTPSLLLTLSSSGDTDELTAAAVWMYKATGKPSFLTDAEGFYNPDTPWGFDWDHKGPGANVSNMSSEFL